MQVTQQVFGNLQAQAVELGFSTKALIAALKKAEEFATQMEESNCTVYVSRELFDTEPNSSVEAPLHIRVYYRDNTPGHVGQEAISMWD